MFLGLSMMTFVFAFPAFSSTQAFWFFCCEGPVLLGPSLSLPLTTGIMQPIWVRSFGFHRDNLRTACGVLHTAYCILRYVFTPLCAACCINITEATDIEPHCSSRAFQAFVGNLSVPLSFHLSFLLQLCIGRLVLPCQSWSWHDLPRQLPGQAPTNVWPNLEPKRKNKRGIETAAIFSWRTLFSELFGTIGTYLSYVALDVLNYVALAALDFGGWCHCVLSRTDPVPGCVQSRELGLPTSGPGRHTRGLTAEEEGCAQEARACGAWCGWPF